MRFYYESWELVKHLTKQCVYNMAKDSFWFFRR